MTNEETQQVQAYIAGLQAKHAVELKAAQRARNIAQQENMQMGKAVHEIRKLCDTNTTASVAQVAAYAKQIIDRYCPDCDIPF